MGKVLIIFKYHQIHTIICSSIISRGITWSYEELNSLVVKLCNVYNSKEFNSSYDMVILQRIELFAVVCHMKN